MASKEDFLNNIAQKLGRSRVYDVQKPKWHRHPWDHLYQDFSQRELVNLFEQEILKLGGEVIRVPFLTHLGAKIQAWLEQNKVKNIISWDLNTPVGQLVKEALVQVQIEASATKLEQKSIKSEQNSTALHPELNVTFWDDRGDTQELISAAERADVGFTIAEHGLAETGSVVLYNRGKAGRLVSLLPSQSANILLAKDVVPRITQVLAQLPGRVEEYSCINFITGPSRSADIEMDLSIGVHGPGHLVVFLIEEYEE